MTRRIDKRIPFLLLAIFVAVFAFTFLKNQNSTETEATTTFNAGNIISNYVMSNYNSMTVSDIQSFLDNKSQCNTNSLSGGYYSGNWYIKEYGSRTYRWHLDDNNNFICLNSEKFGDNGEIGSGQTAAELIYNYAQEYKINPQVILVLLQKEQGLLTDPYPNNFDYSWALGFGAYDYGDWNSNYAGFKEQIEAAYDFYSWFIYDYDEDDAWWNINRIHLGSSDILYNKNENCGSSLVNIENTATVSLYVYTPYQPNETVRSGQIDQTCGAYGNWNFFNYFNDYFGNSIEEKTWPSMDEISKNNRVSEEETDLDLTYSVHIQHYGWLADSVGGEMAGTAGYSLRMEAIAIQLKNEEGIEYRTHSQTYGWGEYVKDGETSGIIGESKRIEAIQIRLTGDMSKIYDVYYRTHLAKKGWTEWSKNDEISGTTGESRQIEAIQIKLVKKDTTINLAYSAHIQTYGWMDWKQDGEVAGTTGESKRMEAIKIKLTNDLSDRYDIYYRVHMQNIGWGKWNKNGEISGTTGERRRIEAIEIIIVDI